MKKVINITIAMLFFLNNISYALSPELGGNVPSTREGMYAGAQQLWTAKVGPGGNWIDRVFGKLWAKQFIGEEPNTKDIRIYNFKTGYKDTIPQAWDKNPIFQKQNLIEALKYYRDYEACIPSDFFEIEEGYYIPEKEKDGELPLARIEKYQDGPVTRHKLIIHTKLVQMWNHIRENDIWFNCYFQDGQFRTVSLAWGIFYRIAKHEMADLIKKDGEPKGGGHYVWHPGWGSSTVEESETLASQISGRYNIINDTIWLWFLQSYCFYDSTRYNNRMFNKRLKWLFFSLQIADFMGSTSNVKDIPPRSVQNYMREIKEMENIYFKIGNEFRNEFPNLDKKLSSFSTKLALAINYHFFSRKGVKVPELTVASFFVKNYEKRKNFIIDTLYAGGTEESSKREAISMDSLKGTIIDGIIIMVTEKYRISKNDDIIKLFREHLNELTFDEVKEVCEQEEDYILKFVKNLLSHAEDEFDGVLLQRLRLKKKKWYSFGDKKRRYGIEYAREQEKEKQIFYWQEELKALIKGIERVKADKAKSLQKHKEQIAKYRKEEIEDINVIVSESTAPLLQKQGPGVIKPLDWTGKKEVWQGKNALYENNIEILIPQSIILTNDIEKKLIETKRAMKGIGRTLSWERYSSEKLIERLKENKQEVKRIVLTDNLSCPQIYNLINTDDNAAALFRDVKLLNIKLPGEIDEKAQTQYQMHLLMTAILVRLLEEGDRYFNDISILLTSMLEDCFPAGEVDIKAYIDTLAVREDSTTSLKKIRQRIQYFLIETPALSLIEKLQVDWEHAREFFYYL